MILSSVVDLRVRVGIVPAHAGRLDKVASWVIIVHPRIEPMRAQRSDLFGCVVGLPAYISLKGEI